MGAGCHLDRRNMIWLPHDLRIQRLRLSDRPVEGPSPPAQESSAAHQNLARIPGAEARCARFSVDSVSWTRISSSSRVAHIEPCGSAPSTPRQIAGQSGGMTVAPRLGSHHRSPENSKTTSAHSSAHAPSTPRPWRFATHGHAKTRRHAANRHCQSITAGRGKPTGSWTCTESPNPIVRRAPPPITPGQIRRGRIVIGARWHSLQGGRTASLSPCRR